MGRGTVRPPIGLLAFSSSDGLSVEYYGYHWVVEFDMKVISTKAGEILIQKDTLTN
jgi:hypothetical protein